MEQHAEAVAGAESPGTSSPAATTPAKRTAGEKPRHQIQKAKEVTRRSFSAEEKIRIVMEGIRGEEPLSALCRRERIQSTVYYRFSSR